MLVEQNTSRQNLLYGSIHYLCWEQCLPKMYVPLSTDEDGCHFIDRCGYIFQYILQFLRCGKLVLPKHFNELDLLQT